MKMSKETKTWIKAAGVRAIKTFAQTMLSMITVGAALTEVNWTYILSCSVVALICSVLTSLTGLPEVKLQEQIETYEK